MKVSVHGLGYVGTVTAAGLVACGHDVIGVDIEPTRVARVGRGESPVVEAGVAELLAQGVHEGRLRATTNVERALDGADLSLLCVGTPSTGSGATNLAHLIRAATDIRAAMDWVQPPTSGHHSVVVRSTVPPGTVRRQVTPIFEQPPEGWRVGTAMCPEFLREGSGLKDFYDPPFVVVGTADPTHRRDRRQSLLVRADGRPDGVGGDGGSGEVRLQRLPRHQGDLRQRDGPGVRLVGRRLP